MTSLFGVFAGVLGISVLIYVIMDWRRGIWGLCLYMPFGGAIALYMHPSKLPLLAKDLLFVIPAYIAFFLFNTRLLRQAPIPQALLGCIGVMTLIVLLQTLNPNVLHWLVAAIGAKVWLFYIPLMFLAAAFLRSQGDLVRFLRVMVAIAILPCLIGLLQWFGSATFGYQETISAFYGDVAANATQGFASFNYGGAYYRIPSTFTFTSQYFGYTWAMIVMAYALMRVDPSANWRRFGLLMMGVFMVSSILSGARSALVFVPILLILIVFLDQRLKGILAGVVLMPALVLGALYLGGINPLAVFSATQTLVTTYSRELVLQNLIDAIWNHPLGVGTGMNTGPARHAFGDGPGLTYLESYYAKAIVELGFFGGTAVLATWCALIVYGLRVVRQLRDKALKGVAAAITAFFIALAIHSGKGWQIDYDPVNVYFWMFAGFLFKLPYLQGQRASQRPRPAVPPLGAYRGLRRPVRGGFPIPNPQDRS